MGLRINRLPAGFVIPPQTVKASKPPVGTDWVHEIKHDGYRMIVHRDGPTVRLYSRNAYDWTERLAVLRLLRNGSRPTASRLTAKRLCWADGLSRFEELPRREAARNAILYAFDLIEHDGEDLRNLSFVDREAALARLLRDTEAGIC